MKSYPFISTEVIQRQVARVLPTLGLTESQVIVAGGCVRDLILGSRDIKDIDVFVNCYDADCPALEKTPNFTLNPYINIYPSEVFVWQGVYDDGVGIPINLVGYDLPVITECIEEFDLSLNQCWLQDGICHSKTSLDKVFVNNTSRITGKRITKLFNKYPTLDWSEVKAYAKGYSWEDVFKNA